MRAWLAANAERTAKAGLIEFQQRSPGQDPAEHLRTLQRRVQAWRAPAILVFDEQGLQAELIGGEALPRPVRAVGDGETDWRGSRVMVL